MGCGKLKALQHALLPSQACLGLRCVLLRTPTVFAAGEAAAGTSTKGALPDLLTFLSLGDNGFSRGRPRFLFSGGKGDAAAGPNGCPCPDGIPVAAVGPAWVALWAGTGTYAVSCGLTGSPASPKAGDGALYYLAWTPSLARWRLLSLHLSR